MTLEPESVTVNASSTWSRSVPGCSPADGWSLIYRFVGPAAVEFQADPDASGTGFSVVLEPSSDPVATPGALFVVAGLYAWIATAIRDDGGDPAVLLDRREVARGTLEVRPDLSALVAGYDARSQAVRILEAIDATLEGRASSDQSAYTINGRSLSRIPVPELLALRRHYAALVHKERGRSRRIVVAL